MTAENWRNCDLITEPNQKEKALSVYSAILSLPNGIDFAVQVNIFHDYPVGQCHIDIPLKSKDPKISSKASSNTSQLGFRGKSTDPTEVIEYILHLPSTQKGVPISAAPYENSTIEGASYGVKIITQLKPNENQVADTNSQRVEIIAELLKKKGLSLTPFKAEYLK